MSSEISYLIQTKQPYFINMFLFTERGSFYLWELNSNVEHGDVNFYMSNRQYEYDDLELAYNFDHLGKLYKEDALVKHIVESLKTVDIYDKLLDSSLIGFDGNEIDRGFFEFKKERALDGLETCLSSSGRSRADHNQFHSFYEEFYNIADLFENQAKQKNIDISFEIEEIRVFGDEMKSITVDEFEKRFEVPMMFHVYLFDLLRTFEFPIAHEYLKDNVDTMVYVLRRFNDERRN